MSQRPKGEEFTKCFAKYGNRCFLRRTHAAWALIIAMQLAKSISPANVIATLHRVSFNGVAGEIAFDEKGYFRAAHVSLLKESRGKWDPIETVAEYDHGQ
jgi:branched-chain amino acid transport system substrate-binding protein